jgi:hypothetical protein
VALANPTRRVLCLAKTADGRKELLNDWEEEETLCFPSIDEDSYLHTLYTIWDFFPASWSRPLEVERVERMGDGGKWFAGHRDITRCRG